MFRSMTQLPEDVRRKTSEQLLISGTNPAILRQGEGEVTLFNSGSLDAHFEQFPDGVHTSEEIERMRRQGLR